ncbi:MAG: hypothetical protein ACLUFN_02475 [Eubacterium sp.]
MACFLVPAAEAIVVTAAYVAVKKKEQKIQAPKRSEGKDFSVKSDKIAWSKKLSWLLSLLWGGVLLLAFEHFWHGEIVPFPPFLSAMSSPGDTAEMLHEMATVGVSMAVVVTAAWGAVCAFADAKVKKIKASLSKNEA